METKQFAICYRLTLLDGSFLETTTNVAGEDEQICLHKLEIWRKTQKPKYSKIEFFDIKGLYNIVV